MLGKTVSKYCFKCNAPLEDYVFPTGGYITRRHYIIIRLCPNKWSDPVHNMDHYSKYIKDLGKYVGPLWL